MSNLNFTNTEILRQQLLLRNLGSPYGSQATLPKDFTSSSFAQQNTSDYSVSDLQDVLEVGQNVQSTISNLNEYGPDEYYLHSVSSVLNGLGTTLNYLESFTPTNGGGLISIINNGASESSDDSEMVRIARTQLQGLSLETMGVKLKNSTLGRINILDAFTNSDTATGLLTGREPLIERDYQITVPGNPITRAAEYLGRVSGGELPVSYIPGEFFEGNVDKGNTERFIDKAKELTGKILNLDFSSGKKSYSQKLLQYTSGGQKSRLFKSVNYNKYQPNFDYTPKEGGGFINNAIDAVQGLIGLNPQDGAFYLGSGTNDPATLFSFDGSTTTEKGYMVSGPSTMVKLFEGVTPLNTYPENDRNYLVGTSSKNVETQFIWLGDDDVVRGTIDGVSVQSNEKTLPENGLLGKTQQIVQEAGELKGEDRLKHPGHIISNVAYKYHDGYKVISKGNAVRGEDDDFCRVWTKDYGYDRYGRLVRYKGIQDTQRRITGSVIKSQMMLNIGPTRDDDGNPINFLNDDGQNLSKYMFSIENLAWSGSEKLKQRPICEQGPNDGRIMWFPPYDMKYTDDNSANWTTHTFLGRPEPIYTYNNTERTGTLSFKVVVDHPTIFNLLRKKGLEDFGKDGTGVKKQELLDSFIAGCSHFDIYELATRFATLDYKDLRTLTDFIGENQDGKLKSDKLVTTTNIEDDTVNKIEIEPVFGREPKEIQLYWFNDIPGPGNSTSTEPDSEFNDDYTTYKNMFNGEYQDNANKITNDIIPNTTDSQPNLKWENNELDEFKGILESIEKEIKKIKDDVTKTLKQSDEFVFQINITSTTSAVASQSYNDALAKRRAESLKKYLLDGKYDEKRIKVTVTTTGENPDFSGINCQEDQIRVNSDVDERIYSRSATYCRTARASITVTGNPIEEEIIRGNTTIDQKYPIDRDPVKTQRDNTDELVGILLKTMHSECDYFKELKETDPVVFDNLVDKLQYFHPSFHSTTPEGLNKRLTFLQQCLRPGETIKVYDDDKNEITDISSNTSFGRPPVCVLRIGDFYHSKIIVNNVNISYDENLWDMNPEGIGMQPMIASVNMGVKFIGGQGISNVINELQNALSFNYYANTEVYDGMATKTEGGRNTEKLKEEAGKMSDGIDDRALDKFVDQLNNPEISEDNDQYWGNLIDSPEETDYIQYNQLYNELISDINEYVNTLTSEVKTLTDKHGTVALITLFDLDDKSWFKTNVRVGTTDSVDLKFIGITTEDYNEYFTKIISNVRELNESDVTNNPIYEELNKKLNFNNKKKDVLKDIIDYLIDEVNSRFNTLGTDINDSLIKIRKTQRTLQKKLDIFDIILGDEIDGYQSKEEGNETIVKFLNNLTVDNGDLKSEVKDSLTKLNNFIEDYTEIVRGDASSFFKNIKDIGNESNLSKDYFYEVILYYFLKSNIVDFDDTIKNNSPEFDNRKVRHGVYEYLTNLNVGGSFISDSIVWENINDANGIYEFVLTDTVNPANKEIIDEFYNPLYTDGNQRGSDNSEFTWKIEDTRDEIAALDKWTVNYVPDETNQYLA